MLPSLPISLTIVFIIITLLALGFILLLINTAAKPIGKKATLQIMLALTLWLTLQSALSLLGIYSNSPEALPPRIILSGVLPTVTIIVLLFITRKGKLFIDRLSMQMLTYVHLIRIPVELCLYALFIHGAVPELMTFEGHNFDIIAGLSAPLVGFFGIGQNRMGKTALLIWNFLCLGLLLNIVINAVLSAPSPFQQFAFGQPNIAILHFPFSLLPSFIVPLVFFAHLAAIRQLIRK